MLSCIHSRKCERGPDHPPAELNYQYKQVGTGVVIEKEAPPENAGWNGGGGGGKGVSICVCKCARVREGARPCFPQAPSPTPAGLKGPGLPLPPHVTHCALGTGPLRARMACSQD